MTSHSAHHRRHDLLLISRLFDIRQHASPFTLILDSLEQSARPLIDRFIHGAKGSKDRGQVVFISFETVKQDRRVDAFIKCRQHGPEDLLKEISARRSPTQDSLIVFDSLNTLASVVRDALAAFLSSLIVPRTSIVGIYHVDVPVSTSSSPYAPPSLTLLRYLSTTILSVHSLSQELARKRTRDRSLAEPTFGLAEPDEGVVAGSGSNDDSGLVVELEARRKSGRSVSGWFVMLYNRKPSPLKSEDLDLTPEGFIRLHEYPPYRASEVAGNEILEGAQAEGMQTTFDLGLSQQQRVDRDNVVLPYFDAQREGSSGEGGRILYDMGVEDDFDDEEDEI